MTTPPPPPGQPGPSDPWSPDAAPPSAPQQPVGSPPPVPPINPYQYPATAQYPPAYAAPPVKRDGKLIAAGVMSIITGAVLAFFGVLFVALLAGISFYDDSSFVGAAWVVALIFAALAALFIAPSIGAFRGSQWARITLIVINALAAVLFIIALITEPEDPASALVPIAWFVIPTALAAFAKPWR